MFSLHWFERANDIGYVDGLIVVIVLFRCTITADADDAFNCICIINATHVSDNVVASTAIC